MARNNQPYQAKAKALRRLGKAKNLPCWICGQPIDYDLDYRDRWSFTADHVKPLARGGSMLGALRPAHRSCNAKRGDLSRSFFIPEPPSTNSHAW